MCFASVVTKTSDEQIFEHKRVFQWLGGKMHLAQNTDHIMEMKLAQWSFEKHTIKWRQTGSTAELQQRKGTL